MNATGDTWTGTVRPHRASHKACRREAADPIGLPAATENEAARILLNTGFGFSCIFRSEAGYDLVQFMFVRYPVVSENLRQILLFSAAMKNRSTWTPNMIIRRTTGKRCNLFVPVISLLVFDILYTTWIRAVNTEAQPLCISSAVRKRHRSLLRCRVLMVLCVCSASEGG